MARLPGIVQGVVVQIDDGRVLALDRKGRENRVADVVLVFDLGLGERGLFDHAPHHRLRAAIEQAVGDELEDFAGDLRLGRIAHRRIGMVPVADDAEPLEFLPLHREPVLGIGAALAAERDDGLRIGKVRLGLALGPVEFLLDLPFDRQPVTVPAGNIVGFAPGHLMRADDNVLQRLVERGADVDVAVGVRRPVMQDEFRAAPASFAQRPIEILARPAGQNLRLLLRQTGAHGEIGLRQIERLRIVEAGNGRVGHGTRGQMGLPGNGAWD